MECRSNLKISEKELLKFGVTLEDVKTNLTLPNSEYANMMRFGKGRFYKKIDSHICYLKKEGKDYILPRYYFGEPKSMDTYNGRNTKYVCNIKLRDYQEEFFKEHEKEISSNTGILIEAACGNGKTVMAIYLSYLRGVQTMVLVPTYYLAKQWKSSIEGFTTASCCILTSKSTMIPTDSDFTIVVMDLFSCRVLPDDLVKNIGHTILDEAHRVGATTYLPILEEIPSTYRTALTATFRRIDGVHRILKYHFGEHFKMENRFPRPYVYAVRTGIKVSSVISKNKNYKLFLEFLDAIGYSYKETNKTISYIPCESLRVEADKRVVKGVLTKTAHREILGCLKRGSELSYSVVDSFLNENSARRKMTISLIQKCLDAGRTVLFLSKRKDVLKALYTYFAGYKPMLIVSETNERSDEDEEYLQNTCPLIFGVTQLAKEGLDIDRLDTLIIHLPMKDTEQAIGRISRLHKDKKFPLCLYLLDDHPITYAVFNNAKKFFNINAEYKGERTLQTIGTVL
mgnify:CR=1 FL=1